MSIRTLKTISIVSLGALLSLSGLRASSEMLDDDLLDYKKVPGVSGTLTSIGSDTLNNMMALWAEAFQAIYPNVKIQIEGKGSSTAPPALIEGTSQLGPMSRAMKATELDKFETKYGYKPTQVRVALDALAVFAHKENPIKGLSMQQVDSIFSSTYKSGGKPIEKWGDLGLDGGFNQRPISLYGRNSASGTYGFFKKKALAKGDFKTSVKEQPGSSGVVQGISSDLYGIGYSGIGYKTSGVKAVAIGLDDDESFEPSYENCMSGDYPLARFLYVYVNKSPREEMSILTREFLRFALSRQGQEVVVKDGYYAMPGAFCNQIIAELSGTGLAQSE